MINYEKLDIAHNLANKISKQNGTKTSIKCIFFEGDQYFEFKVNGETYKYYYLDNLINHMEDLIKPKFIIGQTVYTISYNSVNEAKIVGRKDDFYYILKSENGDEYYWYSNEFYLSRKEAVQAQIKYWQMLMDEDDDKENEHQ